MLPDMPFYPWLPGWQHFEPTRWQAAVEAHQSWESRLCEAGGAAVLGTRPYTFGNERVNAAFVWEASTGCRSAHVAASARNEPGAWETVWYTATPRDFTPVSVGCLEVGFLVGCELEDLEQAQCYRREGVQLLVTPRTTAAAGARVWLDSGIAASRHAQAFGLSSNRSSAAGDYGGQGWIVGPTGAVLALTSPREPFMTREIDLTALEAPPRERASANSSLPDRPANI